MPEQNVKKQYSCLNIYRVNLVMNLNFVKPWLAAVYPVVQHNRVHIIHFDQVYLIEVSDDMNEHDALKITVKHLQ